MKQIFGQRLRFILGVLVLGNLAGCGRQDDGAVPAGPARADDAPPSFSMFFENSTRRDPNQLERDQTLFVNRCTGFFVRNTAGLNLVMSARHCFQSAITSWCQTNGALSDNDGKAGRCARVVAADPTHDIALFEATLPYVASPDRGLVLAAYSPAVDTPLKMIGFPVDRFRQGALTTTESCWIMQADTPSPHGGALNDRSARHNCTTYGGNSGGPMLAAGTDVAVGLPFTYAPNDYVNRSATNLATASHMAKMADFVATHRAELDALGVVIEETAAASPRTSP